MVGELRIMFQVFSKRDAIDIKHTSAPSGPVIPRIVLFISRRDALEMHNSCDRKIPKNGNAQNTNDNRNQFMHRTLLGRMENVVSATVMSRCIDKAFCCDCTKDVFFQRSNQSCSELKKNQKTTDETNHFFMKENLCVTNNEY